VILVVAMLLGAGSAAATLAAAGAMRGETSPAARPA
jgi:hypothetical protein